MALPDFRDSRAVRYVPAFERKDRNRFLGANDPIDVVLPRLATACEAPGNIDVDLICCAQDAGVALFVDPGPRLRYTGPKGALSTDMREAIKRRRGQVIELLSLPVQHMPVRLFVRSDKQVRIRSDAYPGEIILAGERASVPDGLFAAGLVIYRGDEMTAFLRADAAERRLIHEAKRVFAGAEIVAMGGAL